MPRRTRRNRMRGGEDETGRFYSAVLEAIQQFDESSGKPRRIGARAPDEAGKRQQLIGLSPDPIAGWALQFRDDATNDATEIRLNRNWGILKTNSLDTLANEIFRDKLKYDLLMAASIFKEKPNVARFLEEHRFFLNNHRRRYPIRAPAPAEELLPPPPAPQAVPELPPSPPPEECDKKLKQSKLRLILATLKEQRQKKRADTCEATLAELKARCDAAAADSARRISELEEADASLQSNILSSQEDIKAKKAEVAELKARLESARNSEQAAEASKRESEATAAATQAEIAVARAELAGNADALRAAQENLTAAQREVSASRAASETVQRQAEQSVAKAERDTKVAAAARDLAERKATEAERRATEAERIVKEKKTALEQASAVAQGLQAVAQESGEKNASLRAALLRAEDAKRVLINKEGDARRAKAASDAARDEALRSVEELKATVIKIRAFSEDRYHTLRNQAIAKTTSLQERIAELEVLERTQPQLQKLLRDTRAELEKAQRDGAVSVGKLLAKTVDADRLSAELGVEKVDSDRLRALVIEKDTDARKLRGEVDTKTADADRLRGERDALVREVGDKIRDADKLRGDVDRISAGAQDFSRRLAAAEASLAEKQNELAKEIGERLKSQVKLQQATAGYEQSLGRLNGEARQASERAAAELAAANQDSQRQIALLTERLAAAQPGDEDTRDAMEAATQAMREERDRLEASKVAADALNADLTRRLQEAQQASAAANADKEATVAAIQAVNTRLTADITRLQGEARESNQRAATAVARADTAEGSLAERNARLADALRASQAAEDTNTGLLGRLDTLTADAGAEFTALRDQARVNSDALAAQIADLTRQIADLETERAAAARHVVAMAAIPPPKGYATITGASAIDVPVGTQITFQWTAGTHNGPWLLIVTYESGNVDTKYIRTPYANNIPYTILEEGNIQASIFDVE